MLENAEGQKPREVAKRETLFARGPDMTRHDEKINV